MIDTYTVEKIIPEFCRRWNIKEFSFFGSVARNDFTGDSDIDVLVEFPRDVRYSVFDLAAMQDELQKLFGREVDLIEKAALRNPFRKHEILNNRKIIYVS